MKKEQEEEEAKAKSRRGGGVRGSGTVLIVAPSCGAWAAAALAPGTFARPVRGTARVGGGDGANEMV